MTTLSVDRPVAFPESVSAGFFRKGTSSPGFDLGPRASDAQWTQAARSLDARLTLATIATVTQVHGAEVLRVTESSGPLCPLAEADAMVTDRTDLILAIRVADCVPILFSGPGVIGATHSGWRGTARRIAQRTVAALCDLGGLEPKQIQAAIGPCISAKSYEVSQEVVDALTGTGLRRAEVVRASEGRLHVDLRAAVHAQLRQAGLTQIAHLGGCTASSLDLHSYRRDGTAAGRLGALIVRCS